MLPQSTWRGWLKVLQNPSKSRDKITNKLMAEVLRDFLSLWMSYLYQKFPDKGTVIYGYMSSTMECKPVAKLFTKLNAQPNPNKKAQAAQYDATYQTLAASVHNELGIWPTCLQLLNARNQQANIFPTSSFTCL